MKTRIAVLAALAVVLVCSSVAVVYSNNRQARNNAAEFSAVKNLRAELANERAVSVLHDQANAANIKNAGDQILSLTQQKTALCAQIKGARLTQPLCK